MSPSINTKYKSSEKIAPNIDATTDSSYCFDEMQATIKAMIQQSTE